MKFDI